MNSALSFADTIPAPALSSAPQRCPCPCGADLADASVLNGTWILFGRVTEYRTCACRGTRAFMPADVVRVSPRWGGRVRRVALYLVEDTSEVAGEWESFDEALDALTDDAAEESVYWGEAVVRPGAELRRNGVLLARVDARSRQWVLQAPSIEV